MLNLDSLTLFLDVFPETVHGGDPVCVHLRPGASGLGQHAVLGGNILRWCPETDPTVVPTAVWGAPPHTFNQRHGSKSRPAQTRKTLIN